jgi:hypothetical protein
LLSASTGLVLVTDITTTPGRVTLQETTDAGSSWRILASWSLGN